MRNRLCKLAIMPKFVDEGEIALATHFVDLETEDLKYYAGTKDRLSLEVLKQICLKLYGFS